MIIKAEVHIKAPLPVVWRAFSTLDQWKDWNMACDSCRFTLGDSLAEGACFTFVVKPFIFPVRVEPQVSSCDPAREVVWTGNRFGIHAVHTWRFREDADGVLLESVETFRGPLLVIGNMVGIPKRLHRLTVEMLDQIKRFCEACVLPTPPTAPSA
jgi:uncharacterized protein YndB with AHSA1/START domain